MAHRVLLGLGSNIGDRLQFLKNALNGLNKLGTLGKTSHIYQTDPCIVTNQPEFLNMAAELHTDLSPDALLSQVKSIERALGSPRVVDKGPREIDIDILTYEDFSLNQAQLTIPHAALHDRDFVLVPLKDIDPSLKVKGKSLNEMLEQAKVLGKPRRVLPCRSNILELDRRTLIMGILNVTPDSFYDGGKFLNVDVAVARGLEMAREGADIIDIGGESSRPGALPVDLNVELQRVLPVISQLRSELPKTLLSIDTMKAEVAAQAVKAGVDIINNTSPDLHFGNDNSVPVIYMHSRGNSAQMYAQSAYPNGVTETVVEELSRRIETSGLWRFNVIADPGIGFAKLPEDNWNLLKGLKEFKEALNYTTLLGSSNKRFLRDFCKSLELLEGNLAVAGFAASNGIDILRVHEVKELKKFLGVADYLIRN